MELLLTNGNGDEVAGSAFALSRFAETGEAAQTAMGEVGVIAALLQALKDRPKQEEMDSVLGALSKAVESHTVNQLRAMQANGFEALAGVVRDGGGTQNPTWSTTRTAATNVLGLLIRDNDVAKTLALEHHGIVDFVLDELRHEEDEAVQVQLLLVLGYLIDKHAAAQRVLLDTSALPLFMQLKLFDAKVKGDTVTGMAVRLIAVMIEHDSARVSDALWEAGIMEALLTNLHDFTDEATLINVLNVVSCLADDTARVKTLGELFPLEHALGLVAATSGALHLNMVNTICDVVAYNSALRPVVVDRGILAVVVATLRGTGPFLLDCLRILITDDPYVERIAVEKLGVVELLCGLLPSLRATTRDLAATALASMRAAQGEAMANGVLEILMKLLRSDSTADDIKACAACALATLVDGNTDHQTIVADAGALPLVVALVTKDVTTSAGSIWSCRQAARAVANLVQDNRHVQSLAVEGGVVEQLRHICNRRGGIHDEETTAFVEAALAQLLDNQREGEVVAHVHTTKVKTAAEDPSTMLGDDSA